MPGSKRKTSRAPKTGKLVLLEDKIAILRPELNCVSCLGLTLHAVTNSLCLRRSWRRSTVLRSFSCSW